MVFSEALKPMPGFRQTAFSIYHISPKGNLPDGSFLVLVFFLPPWSRENGGIFRSVSQPLSVKHKGSGAGLVHVIVLRAPLQLQIAAG